MDDVSIWEDLDPENDSFISSEMLMPYKGGYSVEFLRELARNTSHNWRRCGNVLLVNNELIAPDSWSDVFDSGRDYVDKYVLIVIDVSLVSIALPHTISDTEAYYTFMQLDTTGDTTYPGSGLLIKAVASGGLQLKNLQVGDMYYYTGMIIELRKVAGS